MKKIVVDKNESIAEVIDRILATNDVHITVSIPKGSALAKSASNFRLLKREADLAEKTVVVESTDETVLDFAKESGIESGHSFLKPQEKPAGVGVSDIVRRDPGAAQEEGEEEEEPRPSPSRGKKTHPVKLEIRDETEEEEDDEKEEESEKTPEEKTEREERQTFFGENRFFKPRATTSEPDDDDDEEDSGGGVGKTIVWILGVVFILGIAFYAVTIYFGHAEVTIDFTQTPWTYSGSFIADKSITGSPVESASGVTSIPAEVFSVNKNITQLFPATGNSATVSIKAQGTITIYNDYSSAPQELVATTRFLTPDGKIFRIVNDVTVPGAETSNGIISPSSITAPIIADQAGPDYNIGPVAKLTIPGFQGTPRENGFYGAILGQTSGGFVGTKQVPSAADIANAKTKTTAILQSDLQDGLTTSYPNNFKILDGATDIQITKLTVSTSTDQNGNFSVFGEASLTAIGFDESALKDYLSGLAQAQDASSTFKTVNLDYSNIQASFSQGQVSFSLSVQGALEPAFSTGDFASSISGDSIADARNAVQGLPQLSDGKISVWPVWLWNMPSDPNKIEVTAN